MYGKNFKYLQLSTFLRITTQKQNLRGGKLLHKYFRSPVVLC